MDALDTHIWVLATQVQGKMHATCNCSLQESSLVLGVYSTTCLTQFACSRQQQCAAGACHQKGGQGHSRDCITQEQAMTADLGGALLHEALQLQHHPPKPAHALQLLKLQTCRR